MIIELGFSPDQHRQINHLPAGWHFGEGQLSTDVGIVPQLFGPRQRELVLTERSRPALEAKLREVAARADPSTRRRLRPRLPAEPRRRVPLAIPRGLIQPL